MSFLCKKDFFKNSKQHSDAAFAKLTKTHQKTVNQNRDTHK